MLPLMRLEYESKFGAIQVYWFFSHPLGYHEETKDEAQQRIWTFCKAIVLDFLLILIYH